MNMVPSREPREGGYSYASMLGISLIYIPAQNSYASSEDNLQSDIQTVCAKRDNFVNEDKCIGVRL